MIIRFDVESTGKLEAIIKNILWRKDDNHGEN